MKMIASLALAFGLAASAIAADKDLPNFYPGAHIDEIIRVRLDRGDLLLESVLEAIQKFKIQDGALLTAVGSLQECTFHAVVTTDIKPVDKFTTVKEPMEILNINGIIARGEPHFHMTLSSQKGAFGGHLEKGCKVLYLSEMTIAKFSGPPLQRKPDAQGVGKLQSRQD